MHVQRLGEQRVGIAGAADLVKDVVATPDHALGCLGIAGEQLDRAGDLRQAGERKPQAKVDVDRLRSARGRPRLVERAEHPV